MGPGAGPEGAAPGGRPMGPESRMSFGATQPGAMMSPADEQNFLLSYRYLDDKGQPISVGAPAAGAAGPEGGAPAEAPVAGPAPPLDLSLFGTGYKRLPIRMVLYMDSRWLPQLITACANEPLRIEVQEVRINPPDGGGVGGMNGGGPSSFGGPSASMAGGTFFPDRTGIQSFPAQPTVATVVVQGTIYIFNKPNVNLLQQPAAAPAGGAVAAQ